MNKETKPQIPLEDRTLLDSLMQKVWSNDKNAIDEVTRILERYCRMGFETSSYAYQLLEYYAKLGKFVM